jgi:hypothetical protein
LVYMMNVEKATYGEPPPPRIGNCAEKVVERWQAPTFVCCNAAIERRQAVMKNAEASKL